jgi:hypothetical protein
MPPSDKLRRRALLTGLVTAGVAAAGGATLLECAPWLDTEAAPKPSASGAGLWGELVGTATHAASGHNTQPWIFVVTADAIEIHPDAARALPIVDPDQRELWISLGCALETLVIAAQARGLAADSTLAQHADFLRVGLRPDRRQETPLVAAIAERQNTRSEYDGRPIAFDDGQRLRTVATEPGIEVEFVERVADRRTVADLVRAGNRAQFADSRFRAELLAWIRFNKREALQTRDGLYTRSSGNPDVPRWLGTLVVSGTTPDRAADTDDRNLRSSPGILVIASATDDRAAWVRAGRVYTRLALTLASRHLTSAFLNQPIEVAALRESLRSGLSLGSLHPQLLVRFGSAPSLPRSLRRPVADVIRSMGG